MVCSCIAAAEETGRAAYRATAVCTSAQEAKCQASYRAGTSYIVIAALCSLYTSSTTQTYSANTTPNTPNATIYTRVSGTFEWGDCTAAPASSRITQSFT